MMVTFHRLEEFQLETVHRASYLTDIVTSDCHLLCCHENNLDGNSVNGLEECFRRRQNSTLGVLLSRTRDFERCALAIKQIDRSGL